MELKSNGLKLTLQLLKHKPDEFKKMLADMEFKEVFSEDNDVISKLKETEEAKKLQEMGVI